MAVRGKHFRFQVYKDSSGSNLAQVPANLVTVDIYRQGAYVEVGFAGLADSASGNITLRDIPRSLIATDDLFQLDQSTVDITRTVRVNTITEATRVVNVRNDTGAALTIAAGERWTPKGSKPALFSENTLTNAVSPLQTGADGAADCYAAEPSVDYVLSGGGVAAKGVPDHNGELDNIWELIVRDVAGVVAGTIKTLTTLTQGTILSIINGTEKWKLDWDGAVTQQEQLTVVAGGILVSAGGITVTGNSTITGTLGGLTGLTVASGGLTVTAGLTTLSGGLTVVGALTLPVDSVSATEIDEATFWTDLTTTGTDDQSETATTEIAYNQLDNVTFTGDSENQLCYAYFSGLIDKDTGGGTLTVRIARRENSAGIWFTIAESVSPALTGGTSHGFAFGGTFMARRTDVVNNIRVTCQASTDGWGQDSSGGATARDKRRLVIRRFLI